MTWNRHLGPDLADHASRIDQERRALHARVLRPVLALALGERAVRVAELLIRVREQRERQPQLAGERAVGLDRVAVDADDLRAGLLELGVSIAELRRLVRSAAGVVFGIEPQNEPAAAELVERARRAGLIGNRD